MRLTLDWDSPERISGNYPAVEGIRSAQGLQRQERVSANGEPDALTVDTPEGEQPRPSKLHYILHGLDGSPVDMLNTRQQLGDDDRRLSLDTARWQRGSPHLQLLFRQKYIPVREEPRDGAQGAAVHRTGKPAEIIAGVGHGFPAEEQVKRANGSLMYPKIARLLAELDRTRFDSGAALMDRIKERKNVTYSKRSADLFYDVKEAKRNWVTGDAKTQAQRAVKKALRDWAEAEGIGHYQDGRAGANSPAEPLRTPAIRRRAYVEYMDIVWTQKGEDDRKGSDYFRELNITTSTVNERHTNKQLHYSHQDVALAAKDALDPTSDKNNAKLEHERGPAPSRAEAQPRSALQEDIVRAGDSRMWADSQIDADEIDAYLDNIPADRTDSMAPHNLTPEEVRRKAERNIIFEVTLYDSDGERAIWHVLGVDDTDSGESIRHATILRDTKGWFPSG